MHPNTYFSLFPPFPRRKTVFVAMSFHPRFNDRWERVIRPGIRSVEVGGEALTAVRVDTRTISDSILTEILDGIGNATAVFADVTAFGELDGRVMRNENVLYEVGLAHALRLPEETLLFRSDRGPLLFDVQNIRVNDYDPDGDPAAAAGRVADALAASLRELDLRRQLSVRAVARSLDANSLLTLLWANTEGREVSPAYHEDLVSAITHAWQDRAFQRLLELGLLEAVPRRISPDSVRRYQERLAEGERQSAPAFLVAYRVTEFGKAVGAYLGDDIYPQTQDAHDEIQRLFAGTDERQGGGDSGPAG